MRLIDAELLVKKIENAQQIIFKNKFKYSTLEGVKRIVENQPTVFDIERVLGEMHESIESCMNGAADIEGSYWNKGIEHCIDIVERGGWLSKAVLIVDMPKACEDPCKFLECNSDDKRFCSCLHREIEELCEKPDWCPLKELPKRRRYGEEFFNGDVKGWNDCLKVILGENKNV